MTKGIGPEGGTVVGDGVTIVIPPGALTSTVLISVAPTGTAPLGFTGLSRLYTFGPDGTAFLKPVSVTVTLDQASSNPVVYWSKPGGGYESVGGTIAAGKITAQITHFSTGFAGASAGDGGLDSGIDATVDSGSSDSGSDASVDAGPQPVTVNTRDTAGVLVNMTWAAWQDGTGAWTALTAGSAGTYGFTPTA